jgi:hypothetical protein
MWWVMVIAERLGIDMAEGYPDTMDQIEAGLVRAVSTQPDSAGNG